MPIRPTYPGVYVEEIKSQVRTIIGVATSITAFVGRTLRGPRDKPVTINNFGDFERTFGGLWNVSQMGFAVQDFFLNGGSQAIIVRVYKDPEEGYSSKAIIKLPCDNNNNLTLEAANEGAWGNNLHVSVEDVDDHFINDDFAKRLNAKNTEELFNLTVKDSSIDVTETFINVSVNNNCTRRIDRILEKESGLIKVQLPLPSCRPMIQSDVQVAKDHGNWKEDEAGHDGSSLQKEDFKGDKTGLYALENADIFNLLCIPPYKDKNDVEKDLIIQAAEYCKKRRAMLIVDAPSDWTNKQKVIKGMKDKEVGTTSNYAALFFPRIKKANPLQNNQIETFTSCGTIAGVFARTDASRGVWKAPAGLEATLVGVSELSVPLTDDENGELNQLGVNCLRAFPYIGSIIWGARTLAGNDQLMDEYKYTPVRRMALFIEESLYRGTKWVVFEPNDEPLWGQIRLNVGTFMHSLFRQGAFQGTKPNEAYFVKCDSETTTQDDINKGIVNILVGFAPLKPAEFVMIKISQMSGKLGGD
jgi:phage tail sheath protein FI